MSNCIFNASTFEKLSTNEIGELLLYTIKSNHPVDMAFAMAAQDELARRDANEH
jgi:hypothetical protein